jgi:tryptophan halogenase
MNIVIVGGGTAGWLAALMISKTQPNHQITLIESSAIGIVGAGEGSTGTLTGVIQGLLWDYGLSEREFLNKTNATIKLGIKHKDWKVIGHEYIAPIDGPSEGMFGSSKHLLHALANNLPFHTASANGKLIEESLSPFYVFEDGLANNSTHSHHFDAFLVGKYFKEKAGMSVKSVDAKIVDAVVDEQGFISSVVLDDGSSIDGDFFIDASGFGRVLPKKLGIDWVSYKKYLPVNTAMPFILPYKEGQKIEPLTTAWAQKNGWMWMIPTQDRIGCGYVFDSTYTSNESAQKEIESALGQEIEPIRFLNFDAGRSEKFWVNNCLVIGLSAAFLEPLEATSIHSTILQLNSFIFNYLRDTSKETCNQGSIKIYNEKTIKMYEGFKDFLSVHYASSRVDSDFWLEISKPERRTDFALNVLQTSKVRSLKSIDFDTYPGFAGPQLYNWVLAGLGYLTKESAIKELEFYGQTENAALEYSADMYNFDKIKTSFLGNTALITQLRRGLI